MTSPPEIAVTEDAFLGGQLVVLQPKEGYRAGLDAVLLAASVRVIDGQLPTVIDVGAGVGVVGLCVARRLPQARVVLIERESVLADLARRNVERNELSDRVRVLTADIAGPAADAEGLASLTEAATHVLANPPFTATGHGTISPRGLKAASHQMPEGTLDDWARFFARTAAPGGTATVIHRADALADIVRALGGRFGAIGVRPVYSRTKEPASRILVTGIKGSRAPLTIQPAVITHGDDRGYRPEIEAILRHGAPLDP